MPTSNSNAINKRGLLLGDVAPATAFVDAASWCWNWASTRRTCPTSLDFVPIMWGEGHDREVTWMGDAAAAIASGSRVLMGFNEPERADQANITDPVIAAKKYQKYMHPFVGKARLCSPSVTDDSSPGKGLDYMRDFLSACKACQVDILCIHVYKTFDAAEDFKNHLRNAYALTNNITNIWVTEWGVTSGTDEQRAKYIEDAVAFMNSQPWIERHSYFYIDPTKPLADGTGAPNLLGEAYINS